MVLSQSASAQLTYRTGTHGNQSPSVFRIQIFLYVRLSLPSSVNTRCRVLHLTVPMRLLSPTLFIKKDAQTSDKIRMIFGIF